MIRRAECDLSPLLVLIVSIALLGSCATVPMAPKNESEAAKQLEVPPGRALIYVYRPTIMGTITLVNVDVNEQVLGAMPVQSFFVIEVAPGYFRVFARMDPGSIDAYFAKGRAFSTMTGIAKAGERYYVRLNYSTGALLDPVGISLQQVDEQRARSSMTDTRLIRHVKL